MAYDTGNPIGSTDARDLSDNAQNLDDAVNSTAMSWVDRLGVTRPTWAGLVAAAGDPVDGLLEFFLDVSDAPQIQYLPDSGRVDIYNVSTNFDHLVTVIPINGRTVQGQASITLMKDESIRLRMFDNDWRRI